MKKRIHKKWWFWLTIIIIITILAISKYNNISMKKIIEDNTINKVNQIEKKAPETAQQKDDREKLTKKIEEFISDKYKGKGYAVDIFRLNDSENYYIVNVRIDYSKFKERDSCEYVAEDLLNKIKAVKNIKTLNIYFGYEDKLTCTLNIDDLSSIKDVKETLKGNAFYFINEQETSKNKEKGNNQFKK